MNLQEKIQQLLFKSHVSCFVDLSRPEKILLVEQATKNVDPSTTVFSTYCLQLFFLLIFLSNLFFIVWIFYILFFIHF